MSWLKKEAFIPMINVPPPPPEIPLQTVAPTVLPTALPDTPEGQLHLIEQRLHEILMSGTGREDPEYLPLLHRWMEIRKELNIQ